uniref:Big defensin BD2 n=2 Tax=Mytilus TaxID=6548 RepID=G4U4J7_MYTGA|nr:big defensin 1 [Mytilus coruscus]CCC15008.1 big defensin BD2 [Mytilus galloprovincialis]
MDQKKILCLLYTTLLILPAQILGESVAESKREKRQAALLPLASYAGLTVAAPLFLSLIAAYGIYAVIQYKIRSDTDNHSCAGNRGWCRSSCRSYEYKDNRNSLQCGSYNCCRPKAG